MWHNRLWRGLREYGWVAKALLTVAAIIGIYMISEAVEFYSDHRDDAVQALFMSQDSLFLRLARDAYDSLSEGSMKWVILVLLEVIIYHFMRQTLKIVLGKNVENAHELKPFINAQRRMLVVSFWALLLENGLHSATDSIFPAFISAPANLAISCGLLGFVVADNYNEQFGLNITQSGRNLWRKYIGICIGLGLPLFFMLKIPLLGAIVGPLVTSVTAAIVLRERSDLHLIGYEMSEKEREKAAKQATKRAKKEAKKMARQEKKLARRSKKAAKA